jgi:hypothetical protein
MMRTLTVFLALAVVPLALATTASANAPTRLSFTVNDTFYASFTSAYCGFDVYRTITGRIDVTLFQDENGSLVREADTGPDFKETFYAPSTGKTFSDPGLVTSHTSYDGGATVGGTATQTLTGLLQNAAGPADAGRIVLRGVVVGFDPDGIPLVDTSEFVSGTGHLSADPVGNRCAALR